MSAREGGSAARSTAEAVARRSYGKLLALLAARTRDLTLAEDALSEAFARALSDWPEKGAPDNPEAWLLTVARRKAIDEGRHRARRENVSGEIRILAEEMETAANASALPDQRLALLFACAHPAIDESVRAPMILQTVLGFDAARIASAFLVSPASMSQRLVRAKAKIREAGIAFAVPEKNELPARLEAVLDAIYAAFAEGWNDPARSDAARRDLADEAIYLGLLIAELLPGEPEALGLAALMLHAEARRQARRGAQGEFVPLAEQDPARWDRQMIARAEGLLGRAGALGRIGRYQLEAALQSAHVHRRISGFANWQAVAQIYDALFELTGSPVVAINRALALAEVDGAEAALAVLRGVEDDARLKIYQPYWAARATLLARAGNEDEARKAFDIAIGLEKDPAVRAFLQVQRERV